MSEQNIVNVMVIPDVPKVLPGEQLYVYVPKASFTSPGIIAYNSEQFEIDGNFLFIRKDYVSPGVTQKIAELKEYTDGKLQLKQDKEDSNINLSKNPEQKTVVGAINELGQYCDEIVGKIGDFAALTTDEKGTVVGAINEVDKHTDNAQQSADNATTLANTGISKAEQAQSTANTAVDKANDAKATAEEAIMKADGRSNSIGFMTAKDAVTALNDYPKTQLKAGDTIWIVETGTPDLWVTEVAENSVPYNYTTKDKFNQDLVDNKVLQIGYFKTAYQESDGKPVTIAWQNVVVKNWVASTEFADFPYEAKIELTDFVDYTTVPQVVFDIADTMSGNYAPICKSGDKCVYIYGKVQNEITLKTVITFAPNVNGASVTGGGYNNRGKWVASTTYAIDDLVYTDNGQYVCIEGITSTTSPEQDTTHWQATFVATGKTKNGLKFSGQNGNGTEVQKTFDGSTPVEVAFDEQTMTAKEVNGVLEIGAKGTVPEALPQEASAVKSGNLPTTGWTNVSAPLWQGVATFDKNGNNKTLLCNIGVKWNNRDEMPLTGWAVEYSYISDTVNRYTATTFQKNDSLSTKGIICYFGIDNTNPYLEIDVNGDVYGWTLYTYISGRIIYKIEQQSLSKQGYTISDTSITTNSDILMELTDDGGVKAYSMEAGKMTVIRDTVPTQPIPYTYKVKQTNAEGLFEVINAYVPTKTSDLTNDSGFIKPSEANTFTGEQTFSNANGIKTNRVHNLNDNAWYDFDGTSDRFGSLATPTIIRTSEARPKAEVPSGSGTVTKELALLEDVQGTAGALSDIVQSATITEQGTYYVLTNRDKITQVAGNPSIVYWNGSTAAYGTRYVYSTVVDGVFTLYEFWAMIASNGTMTAYYNSAKCENGVWTRVKSEEPVGFQYKKITN